MWRKISFIMLATLVIISNTCVDPAGYDERISVDLSQIRKRGKIVAVTNFNSTDYFIYKGRPMGFQFEMLQRFAERTNLQLELITCNDIDEVTSMLLEGKCDLVAMNIPVSSAQGKYVSFTTPLMQSKQVLVQRKPEGWKNMTAQQISAQVIRDPLLLSEKSVVVQKGTAYALRLKNISSEIGEKIDIIQVPEPAEQLIQFVAGGEIDYTVCDENLAKINQKYYPQLDVSTELSFSQNLAWAVRKSSPELLEEVNAFITREKRTAGLVISFNKYYQNEWANARVNNDYFVLNTGRISPYDDEIKKLSELVKWDWRLIAALIFQESNFNPSVKSHRGALGLMQIMPSTALWFGYDSIAPMNPSKNLELGVKLLRWLDKCFINSVPDKEERINFVLASYNIGIGHIRDAQNLAEKYGYNRAKWTDVREFLINKSQEKYYTDPVVKFGYCKGTETYAFVTEVLNHYSHYKNIASLQ